MAFKRIVLILALLLIYTVFSETNALVKNDSQATDDPVSISAEVTEEDMADFSESEDDDDDDDPIKGYRGGYEKYGHGGHYEPKDSYNRNRYDDKYGNKYDKGDKYDKYGKDDKYDKYGKDDKYDKYDKYDKDDKYDKYGKYDKYDKYEKYDKYDKYDKEDYDMEKYYGYKDDKYCHKEKSHECVAYIAVELNGNAQLYQSINGEQATLSSTYTQPDFSAAGVFSNRARGAYCVNNDIEMFVGTSGGDPNVYLTRFEASSTGASRVYTHETGLTFRSDNTLVTRILLKRLYKIIDAYFVDFTFGYAQYDVNPLTNKKVSVSFPQSVCFDTAFFKEDNSRFVCQGITGYVETTYSRDPETGVNFIPPVSHNPWVVGKGDVYTSVRLCKRNYISSLGYDDENGELILARARFSLKYPYFKDIEELYTDAQGTAADAIYTPAHSNTIYVCYQSNSFFWFARFDNAYTDEAPLTPAVTYQLSAQCTHVISFNKCPNDIYIVDANNDVQYSNDGGVTFNPLVFPNAATNAHSITGFAKPVKDYY